MSGNPDVENRLMNSRLLHTAWEAFHFQPRQPGFTRHLVLPDSLVLDTVTLESLVQKMRRLLVKDRPVSLTIKHSTFVGSDGQNALLFTELLDLCKVNLRCLNVSSSTADDIPLGTSLGNSSRVLERLESLSLLSIPLGEETNLSNVFESESCQIRNLAIEVYEMHHEYILEIIEAYSGLQKLHIECGELDDDQVEAIQHIFNSVQISQSRLTHLHFRDIYNESEHVPFIASMIQEQNELQVLDFSNSSIIRAWYDDDNKELFLGALAQHPTLQELVLYDSMLSNEAFTSLLHVAEQNPRLCKLHLGTSGDYDPNEIDGEGDWVNVLPRLQNLRSLSGFQYLADEPDWNSVVLPALRKNTSLIELDYVVDNFALNMLDLDDLTDFDNETVRILARNKLLHETVGLEGVFNPPLGVWPLILHRLASREVESSALLTFLRTKAAEIPEPKLLQENKNLLKENKILRENMEAQSQWLRTLGSMTADDMKEAVAEWMRNQS